MPAVSLRMLKSYPFLPNWAFPVNKIRWLHLALADLDELMAFITRNRPESAASIAAKIWQAVQRLAEQPAMGRPGRVPGTREPVVAGTPFIVPYRCIDKEVHVLRVLHWARKWPGTL